LKLWVLGWQQGRNFGNRILAFHRWMRFRFGCVIMLNVTYILTGGIVNSRLCLRVILSIITYPKRNLIQRWKAKIWLPKFLPCCHPKTHSFKSTYSFYFSANQAIIMQLILKFTRTIIPPKIFTWTLEF
jgi:hypothetical protein